jgi:hypothetical protein
MTGRQLDWAMLPCVVKCYPGSVRIPLRPEKEFADRGLWELLDFGMPGTIGKIDYEILSSILAMGNGITFQRRDSGKMYSFRSAASAGALYPVEIYVDACGVEGFEDGL